MIDIIQRNRFGEMPKIKSIKDTFIKENDRLCFNYLERYQLSHSYIFPFNLNGSNLTTDFSSVDEIVDNFLSNPDFMLKYQEFCENYEIEDLANGKFEIIKNIQIEVNVIEYEDSLDSTPSKTYVNVRSYVHMNGTEFFKLIKEHPKYKEYLDKAEHIRKENERIAQENYQRDVRVKNENQYHMYMALKAKYDLGEFKEFEKC